MAYDPMLGYDPQASDNNTSTVNQPAQPKPLVSGDQINAAYQKYLGRSYDPSQDPNKIWANNPNFESDIAGSAEAKQWSARAAQNANTPAGTPASNAPTYDAGTIAAHALRGLDLGSATSTYNPAALAEAFKQKQFDTGEVGGSQITNLQSFLNSLGGIAKGVTVNSPDSIRLPDGRIVDVIQNVNNGAGKAWWGGGGDSSNGSGGGSSSGVPGSASGIAPGGIGGDARNAFFQTLLDRSKQSLGINAQTDANIRQQADPYAAAVERSRRNYLADTAEKAGPYANLQGENRVTAEKAGEASGLFESTLVGKELQARRDEIQNALTAEGSMLSDDQRTALQQQLAAMNDALQRTQLGQQNNQYLSTLGFNSADRAAYWDAVHKGLV